MSPYRAPSHRAVARWCRFPGAASPVVLSLVALLAGATGDVSVVAEAVGTAVETLVDCAADRPPAVDLAGAEPGVREQLTAAAARLSAAVARGSGVAEQWAELGVEYHAYELLAAATCAYRNTLALRPDDLATRYRLAVAFEEGNQPDLARAELERVVAVPDRYAPALMRLAALELAAGHTAQAAAWLAPVEAALPEEPAVLALAGELALARGDAAVAVARLEAALAAEPRADRLHYPLGLAYRALGDAERARAAFASVGRAGARLGDPWLEVVRGRRRGHLALMATGLQAYRAGDFAAAAGAFAEAAAVTGGRDVGALVNLAASELALGERTAAGEHLAQAHAAAPENLLVRFNLAALQIADGRYADARALLEAVVAARPDDQEAGLLLVAATLGGGDLAGAERMLSSLRGAPVGLRCAELATAAQAVSSDLAAPAAEHLRALLSAHCRPASAR